METKNSISNGSLTIAEQQHGEISQNINKKINVKRCKICRKKFKNKDSYTAHIKLHKVTRKLSNVHSKKAPRHRTSKQSLLFECRICGTKHQGFSECFEHQRLHEEHSKFFNNLFTSDHIVTEDNAYHILNNDTEQPTEVIIATSSEEVELLESDNINDQHEHVHSVDNSSLQSARECFTKALNKEVEPTDVINLGFVEAHSKQIVPGSVNVSSHLPVPFTTSDISLMDALSTVAATQTPFIISTVSPSSASCKLVDSNDGMQIEIPSQVKAIYLNSTSPDLSDVLQKLDELNNKVDSIIRYLNDPANTVPLNTASIHVHPDHRKLESEDEGESVILEGFPPSYSIIQAAKEQQQQEYYASSIANRQGQIFKTNEPHNAAVPSSDIKGFTKKPVDIWIPTQQYLSTMSALAQHEEDEKNNDDNSTGSNIICKDIVDKVFLESRSRANFAKNLCFAIFSYEERQGKNCTGRVFGKAQHKGQLDPVKVQAIKDVTFRKYPSNSSLVDITWRKECVTAIDSGLRNENRTAKSLYDHKFQQVNDVKIIKVDDNGHQEQ